MSYHDYKGPYGANDVWQQDAAPCHMAKKTQEYHKENMPNFWGKEIAITLIIHRNTVNNVEKILNLRHNSYIHSVPILDVPAHVKHVSLNENLLNSWSLGLWHPVAKKCPNEWVSDDVNIKNMSYNE